jgi:uncharacterized delta-60 repeat protein
MRVADRRPLHVKRLARAACPAIAALAVVIGLPAPATGQAPGTPDLAFGFEGLVTTSLGSALRASGADVAIDALGRIVVAGYGSESGTDLDFAVLRYLPDGQLDPSFGGDGRVSTPIGSATGDLAASMAIQPDGRILVAGFTAPASSTPPYPWDVALVRYLADGSLDASFGAGGIAVTHLAEPARGLELALQPDGKALVAAVMESNGPGTGWDPLVLRYHANGFLDPTFGVSGMVRLTLNGQQYVTGLGLTTSGRILVSAHDDAGALLVRLRSNGDLDDTFGTFGIVFSANPNAEALVVQPDGKIVLPGWQSGSWGCCGVAVARHHSSGAIDAAFGADGVADPGWDGRSYDAVVQPNGKIVVAGNYGSYDHIYPFLWRVNADGTIDPGFQLQFPDNLYLSAVTLTAVALQADGKIVAVVRTDNSSDIHVARYHGDRPDLIFADGFESGTVSAWSASATGSGDLGVSASAALASTAWGVQGVVDDTEALYVQDDTPDDESRYRARFHFDPNGFDPGEGLEHRRTRLFIAFAEDPMRRLVAVVLRRLNGAYSVMARVRQDDNTQVNMPFVAIDDGPHVVEFDWRRATGPDAFDGAFELWIDGVSIASIGGLDNSDGVDFARLGALSVKTGASGTLLWDEFESRRETYIGP